MNSAIANAQELARADPDGLQHVDPSWLVPLGVQDATQLGPMLCNLRAKRLLKSAFRAYYGLCAEVTCELPPSQAWVLRGRDVVHLVTMRLGLVACAEFIRTSISHTAVEALHTSLGRAEIRRVLDEFSSFDDVKIDGLKRESFDASIAGGTVREFVTGVGENLLGLALADADGFVRQRLRFAFPTGSRNAYLPGLSANDQELQNLVARLAEAA